MRQYKMFRFNKRWLFTGLAFSSTLAQKVELYFNELSRM